MYKIVPQVILICCAVTAGVARAAANVSRLQLVRNVSRCWPLLDMHALSAEELLLVCGNGTMRVLRSVSLRTGLFTGNATAIRGVYKVAFDANTNTLLLAVLPPEDRRGQLVSLRRNGNEWLEMQRSTTIGALWILDLGRLNGYLSKQ